MKSSIRNLTPAVLAAVVLGIAGQGTKAGEAPAAPSGSQSSAREQAAAQEQAAVAERAEKERELAAAQRELEETARRVAELSRELGARAGNRLYVRSLGEGPPRAMLGVQIAQAEGQGGARVEAVSPGGPAAEAGIKVGDIITSIGGVDLTKDSSPSRALVEHMRQLDPNLKVQVGVTRDGKKQNFEVTPRPSPEIAFAAAPVMIGRGGPQTFEFQRGGVVATPGGVVTLPGAPGAPMAGMRPFEFELEDNRGIGLRFRGMEFATLSEQLGGYFGVKSGVLVVRAGNNEAFKFRDGDVILAIDGREPTNAQHAGRILRSYQAGEKLSIRIQRERKAQNLEVTVPGGRGED